MVTSTTAGVSGRTLVSAPVCALQLLCIASIPIVQLLVACSMPKCKWSKPGQCEGLGMKLYLQ